MKVRVTITEMEASADELRASQTLASAFTNVFRNCFTGVSVPSYEEDSEGEDEDN